MKSLIRVAGFAVLIALLHSCTINRPITTLSPKNNGTYTVDYLFEHDGCKVYRFQDMGHWVYFTNCTGDVTSFQNDSVKTAIKNTIKKSQVTYKSETPSDSQR